MKYHAMPFTIFSRGGGRTVPKISWRVVDTDAGHNERFYPIVTVASCTDEAVARRIADMMNGVNDHAMHWQNRAHEINGRYTAEMSKVAVLTRELEEARGSAVANGREAERARTELAEAHQILNKGGFWTGPITVYNEKNEPELVTDILARLEKAEAAEREVRKALEASHRDLAGAREYWGADYTAVSQAATSRTLGVPMVDHVRRLEQTARAHQCCPTGWTSKAIADLIAERDAYKRDNERIAKTGAFVLCPSADVVRDQDGNLWQRTK